MEVLFSFAKTLIKGGGALMRIMLLAAVVCFSVMAFSVAEESQAVPRAYTNIPAQGLGPALQFLAKEHGIQLIYVSEEINGLRTAGAVGDLTADQALRQLLKGTG